MSNVVIFKNPDNSVGVLYPNPAYKLDYVVSKDIPEGVEYRIIKADELPKEERSSWEWGEEGITINKNRLTGDTGEDIKRSFLKLPLEKRQKFYQKMAVAGFAFNLGDLEFVKNFIQQETPEDAAEQDFKRFLEQILSIN